MGSTAMPFPSFFCVVIAVAALAKIAFAIGGAIRGSGGGNSNEFMSRFGTGMENCELMA